MSTPVRTLILGGGISGLSCAYHLKDRYLLLERSADPGGLARSVRQDGFVFDYTGHLLHLRNPYTLKLIPQLLGDNLVLNDRRAWIYSHGTYTRYPFQANLYGLPRSVIMECLQGLVEAQLGKKLPTDSPEPFAHWVLRTFGRGFAKHFFFPYNEKLWAVTPETLTAEWAAPFVPKPSIEEAVMGAFTDQTLKFGYNASFYYPREGGIQSLSNALAQNLKHLRLRSEVTAIDLTNREATLSNLETIKYDYLVNTLPLPRFIEMCRTLPAEVPALAQTLRWSSVYNINLGVRRAKISDKHWIYFPEKKYRFYRVGFPMNFTPAMAPPGYSSMYVEIGHASQEPVTADSAMRETLAGLRECGLLRPDDEIVTRNILPIPVAYVTYDRNRTRATDSLLSYMQSHRVLSIGRYGGWKYSYMEEAILEGKAAAEEILGCS